MRLRSDVILEPLVDRWYAWTHLVPPVTAALNIARRHLPILASYVRAPGVHAAAVRNPAMMGGPFAAYDRDRSADVGSLMAATKRSRADLLSFAEALQAWAVRLDALDGGPLEPLYAELPAELRGRVELVHDGSHHASMRFIERLMYRSPVYDRSMQAVAIRRQGIRERRFALSTPRLDEPEQVIVDLPFDLEGWDALSEGRVRGRSAGAWSELLCLEGAQRDAFLSMCTVEPPPPRPTAFEGVRVRYLGHAGILVSAGPATVLIDPVLGPLGGELAALEELPERIDAVLITHGHMDHFHIETLLQLRHRLGRCILPRANGTMVDPCMGEILRAIGFGDVVVCDAFDEVELGPIRVTVLPFLGEHGDLDVRAKATYHVEAGDRRLLFLADANAREPRVYQELASWLGPVDALFLGMECDGGPLSWLYGPLLGRPLSRSVDRARTLSACDADQARSLVEAFRPGRAFVYALALEAGLEHLTGLRYTDRSPPIVESRRFLELCAENGLRAEILHGAGPVDLGH